jgi:hypothetical protein
MLISACALVAGCGSTAARHAAPAEQPSVSRNCDGGTAAQQAVQRSRLDGDMRKLRNAARTMKHYAQDGNAATNTALDRFMRDIGNETLSAVERNRYIDHAAAIVAPRCYLCFQTLEYNRPLAAGAKLACG